MVRFKQHARDVEDGKNRTALAYHAVKHEFGFSNVAVLEKENNCTKRRIKEL